MSDEKDIADLAAAHSGWIAAFFATTWGIVLRALVGRHMKREEKLEQWITSVNAQLAETNTRLSVIESRSFHRRREDRRDQYMDDPT